MLNVVSTLLRKKTSLRRYTLFLSLMVFLLSLFNLEMINCCCGSVAQSCPISVAPWTATCRASLSFIISWPWLKFMSIESLMLSNHFTLCFLLPSIFQASGSFPKSWLFTSGGQIIEASASASVLPVNIQG